MAFSRPWFEKIFIFPDIFNIGDTTFGSDRLQINKAK